MSASLCPLCLSNSTEHFHQDKKRDYFQCRQCRLVFVPVRQHLDPAAEKAIYDLHENRLDDAGYRRFLSRFAEPLAERVPRGATGLDYGCGPGPLLAHMLAAQGYSMQKYDPLYANQSQVLQLRYEFVTCTEVVEHFRRPIGEFQRLFGLLKPKGLIGIMTKLVIDADAFSRWHYKNDMTHLSFFSRPTFQWLADEYDCSLEILGNDVVFLQKRH